jgi:hypothetical protein
MSSGSSTRPDERERPLRHYLGLLKKHAEICSNKANEIAQRHVPFASLMAQRIDDASESQYNSKYDEETTRLAKDINEAAGSLSIYVARMKDNLNLFVSTLEGVQITVKKEPSRVERILRSYPWKNRSDQLVDAETQEGDVRESLDSVILFLKRIVPREAQNAQKNLERFDETLDIMGLERHMRVGQRVTPGGPDPAAVAKKWRDVAELYQSVLPDDEPSL